MLKLYVSTVIIYTIVLWASVRIAGTFAGKNGWLDTPRLDDGGISPFILALVPVVRLLALIGIWYMAFNKKQH